MSVRWNISVTTILLIAAVIFVFILRPFSCDSRPSRINWLAMHNWLENHAYTEATPVNKPKPHGLTPEIKENATATTSGAGIWIPDTTYTPEDTVAVELSEVTLGDGTHWVNLEINGKPIIWHQLEHYQRDIERRWSAFAEVANAESAIGIGIGYCIWKPLDINVSPAVVVSTRLDWIAGELRLSRNIFSGVALGGGGGWRLRMSQDVLTGEPHLSAGVSIEL